MEKETGKHLAGGRKQPRGRKSKEKRPKKPSRLTRQQKLLIALAVVLALVVVIVAAWKSLFIRPDLSPKPSADSEETEEIDWGEGTRPRSDGERKSEDYYTVLILGRDTGGGGNTDTMLLASYDVTNQKATVMSIPRDTMVNIPYDIKRINAVYNYGGKGEKGIQYLYKEISQLVGFEPDYQVIIEWEAVGEIVDAMGGVWFDVPRNMNYDDPYQDLSIHIEKGYQLLDGEGAMGVLRYRHDNDLRYGYPDGDLGRIKTQQAFLQAMVEQLLKVKNVTKINEFIKVFQDNVETDLSFQNILWFAQAAVFGGLSIDNVNFVTMPNKNVSCWSRSYHSYQSYVTPIANELLDLVNNELSPYVEQFTLSDLDIMSVNSDGSVSSSTGYVEDSKAASPPVTSSGSGGGSTTAKPEENQPVTDENGNILDPETGEIIGNVNDGTTTDPGTGGTTTDSGTGGTTTDPGTGGTTTDPGTGGITTDPGTGGSTTDPGTGGTTTDPGTGGSTTDPGTGGTTTDPGAGGTTTDPGTGDSGFVIIDPAPAA